MLGMNQLNAKLFVLSVLYIFIYGKHEQYIGWKSYYVGVSTDKQFEALGPIVEKHELDFLSHPTLGREGVVLVKPQHQDAFTHALDDAGIAYRIHVDDIKRALDYDDYLIEVQNRSTMTRNGYEDRAKVPFLNYSPIEMYNDYLSYIDRRFWNVQTIIAAWTYEGQGIRYVKISNNNFEDRTKPLIYIDGGIHAREWISPAVVGYIIYQLVEHSSTYSGLVNRFDWILFPIVNPDGYKYSFTTSRLWRKNRSATRNKNCRGVDLNRNFGFRWNYVGVSKFPCNELYPGTGPFSEIESQVVRDILRRYAHRMAMYITMHSFGSLIMYPWGHDGSLSNQIFPLDDIGRIMVENINRTAIPSFPRYKVGNSANLVKYFASGISRDYAHRLGVKIAYTIELPGLEKSGFRSNGFHLDPTYIPQICSETWDGIVAGVTKAGDAYPDNYSYPWYPSTTPYPGFFSALFNYIFG